MNIQNIIIHNNKKNIDPFKSIILYLYIYIYIFSIFIIMKKNIDRNFNMDIHMINFNIRIYA